MNLGAGIPYFFDCPSCAAEGQFVREQDPNTRWVHGVCNMCGYEEDEPPWVVDGKCTNGKPGTKWEHNVCPMHVACDTCKWYPGVTN